MADERLLGPILITGVNGFIAGHLAEKLLDAGIEVRGTARRPAAASWLAARGATIVPLDLLVDGPTLSHHMEGCRSVVHAAAWTGGADVPPETGMRINIAGTANVLRSASRAGIQRFLYVSSVAVYGLNGSPLIDETVETTLVGQAYPDSKIRAEWQVRESGVPSTIIRPASTYGPRGAAWTVGPIEQIKRGRMVLLGRDNGLVTPGYIENVVEGLMRALRRDAALGETFNLCDDRAVTYREFYLAYARMLGKDHLRSVPSVVARLARLRVAQTLLRMLGRPSVGPWSAHFRLNPSQYSVAKAERVLDYRPAIGFEEGMRRTEVWLRQEGYLTP